VHQSYSKPKLGRFLRHGVVLCLFAVSGIISEYFGYVCCVSRSWWIKGNWLQRSWRCMSTCSW